MKILGTHLDSFVSFAVLRGISRESALGSAFDHQIDLTNELVKVSKKDFQNVIGSVATKLDDELLGLHVGQHLDFTTLGVVHKISLKATSIEEGLYYCQAYLRQTFPYIGLSDQVQGKLFSITVSLPSFAPRIARIVLETMLTVITRELGLMWGKQKDISTYSPFFDDRYPKGWGMANEFKVTCEAKILASNIKDYSRLGLDILVPSYLRMVELMKSKRSFRSSVKCTALALATPVLPSIARVAFQYNCNVRTFQRRLASEGFTYREIIEEIKIDLSDMLLRHDRFSIGDISGILGYAEPAAFVRNFKKWRGKSPLQFRKDRAVKKNRDSSSPLKLS
jgi:AraC-like DNA-binding protein